MRKSLCVGAALLTLGAAGQSLAAWNPAAGDWGKTASTDVRVMAWNVLDGIRASVNKTTGTNNWHAIVRTIALLQPDVVIFEETGDNGCSGCVDSVATLLTVCDQLIHGGGGATIYVQLYAPGYDLPYVFVSSETDGFNRNIIMSRYPFTDLNGDTKSIYPDIPTVSAAATWAPGGDGGIRGFMFAEIDLPNATYSGNLVFGGAHLKAGSNSSDHTQRVTAAQNVSWFIDQWYNGAGTGTVDPTNTISDVPAATAILGPLTPVVIGGDWNEDEGSNGSTRGPEAWLSEGQFPEPTLDGVDRDRTDMNSTFNLATDLAGDFDTRGSSTLDYLAWQDSIATHRRAVIFNSANISTFGYPTPSPEWDGIGFPSTISAIASDHLAIFVDLIVPLGVPTGACCFGTTCQVLTEDDCAMQGGTYQGDDTLCTPTPCQPIGACCIQGLCSIETQADCVGMGGAYQGDETDCMANPCPAVGACCINGSCTLQTQANCAGLGGTYDGDGTMCVPNPCPQLGACCIAGACSIQTQVDCLSMSGQYLGDNTSCAGNPCPTTGACCFSCSPVPTSPCPDANGATGPICSDLTSLQCQAASGIYRGDGTSCAQGLCVCRADLNADGKTDVFDFGLFAGSFGAGMPDCAGHSNGDLNCDGVVNVFDFSVLAGEFGCQ